MSTLTDKYEQFIDPYVMGFTDTLREENTLDAIRAYLIFIKHDLRPTDNILMIIGICFARYIESNGSITLDEAFRLLAKQGTGSPLKLRKSMEWKASAHFVIWYKRKVAKEEGRKVPSIISAAIDIIDEFKIPHPTELNQYFDAETLKKSFITSRAYKLFEGQDQLSKKHNRHDYMLNEYNKCVLYLNSLWN